MDRWLPGLLAVLGILGLALWLASGPGVPVAPRLPDSQAGPVAEGPGVSGAVRARLVPGPGLPSSHPGSWPAFRGPNRDGISPEATPLARSWPQGGPRALWRLEVGEGYAGAAIHRGRVYLHDYDQQSKEDAIRCLSLDDGREIWRHAYPVLIKRNHGMSRTVPAVNDRYLVAIGPKCHVTCLVPDSGQALWQLDLVKDFGALVPPWYAGQCPLLEAERVILAPCGPDLLLAVQASDGKLLWRTPNSSSWKMTHVSIVPMRLDGQDTYVYAGSGGVAGIDARNGERLWETRAWRIPIAAIASPVPCPGGRLFLSGGYDAGCMMLRLARQEGRYQAEVLFRLGPEHFGATQQTPILFENHLYGVRPDGELACLDLEGKVRWSSGSGERFGIGPQLLAGGLLYLVDDQGILTLCEANPVAYRRLARAKVLPGHDSWGPLALAAGRLIARDLSQLVCLDVASGP